MPEAVTPRTYPYDVVRVACAKCGRAGRYLRERLLARHGRDAEMPDVPRALADCPRWSGASDPYGAYFPDLMTTHDRAAAMADAEAYINAHATTPRRLSRT